MSPPKDLTVLLRSVLYAFRGGFLVRPFAIATVIGLSGMAIARVEQKSPLVAALTPRLLFPAGADSQIVQSILSDIATSIMTVVSIVFAILLMTLTLASTQFSPRILISFIRDRVTQWTLGVFLGTFSYCIAVLPAATGAAGARTPVLSVTGAMALAAVCTGWLIYFIHHISNAISVNHIVDRIRRETELIIDELMPHQRKGPGIGDHIHADPQDLDYGIKSRQSGYIRFIDLDRLMALAKEYKICLRLERRIGHYVPEGVVIMRTTRGHRVSEEREMRLLSAIDLGPIRTMQQDVEFGIVQIVDIGLRALSPAVNDPTTAISCVDQLTSILIRWLGRRPPPSHLFDPPHVLRVVVHQPRFEGLIDLAFEQIRHYARSDAAVSLRLMRALGDIASVSQDPKILRCLRESANRVVEGGRETLQKDDFARLQQRMDMLQAATNEVL